MRKLILVVGVSLILAGCGPTCDSSNPQCMLYTPPASVQHRYFVECMRLSWRASNETSVEACESYAFRMADKEVRDSIPVTVKSYQ